MADRYSIVVEGRFREPLEDLARSLGFQWGDRGNVKELIQSIASGKTTVDSIIVDGKCRESLEDLARLLGFTGGDRGNVKDMVKAIAEGCLPVGGMMALSTDQQEAIGEAAIAAFKRGAWEDALMLGDAFYAFQDIDPEFRGYVAGILEPLKVDWIPELMRCIDTEQAFKLRYRDAAERDFSFTVCGAQLVAHERRIYLDCWCLETEGNQDIVELQHNWCLRLDRIVNAEILEVDESWRSLDSIEIQMRLTGGLSYGYEQRAEDISIEREENSISVIREISNTFWFIREILRYGKNCEIISPSELRDRVASEIKAMAKAYE